MSRIASRHAVTQCVAGLRPAAAGRFPSALALRRLLLLVLAMVCVLPARAADSDAQPAQPKAFSSIDEATRAAAAAREESDRIKRQYEMDAAECMHKFFANSCVEKARVERNEGVTRADAARREAELYIRREQARQRHQKRDQENAERDARAAERTARKADDAASRQPSTPEAPPAHVDSGASAVVTPPPRPARDVDDPQVRAQNRANFERKQAEAREYAEKQAKQREEAEGKRARRRAQREEEAARLRAREQEVRSGLSASQR
ncbi:MAG: hypothetical protein QHC78_06355 [Pigmentiphaga sp.]|uniref:hypothetical protein n=1 Tax=Pigmentiphaga sp. TaxID=1977564 RepID=UPI0029A5CD47|nr:hypothetical protein [Pigmentiphaga sp.]MDX3905295.1 hypothetical protein [Pigmentiphaga sp.]